MTWSGPRSYAFRVDTRATDAAGQPRLADGQHVLRLNLRQQPLGPIQATTTQTIIVAN